MHITMILEINKMNNKNKKQLTEEEQEDYEFEQALNKLPVTYALSEEDWDCPEDDAYWIEWQKRKHK